MRTLAYLMTLTSSLVSVAAIAAQEDVQPAQDAMTESEALTVDARYYASRYGVDLQEAARRIRIMSNQEELIASLELDPADISGIWFEHAPQFTLQVRTLRPYRGKGQVTERGRAAMKVADRSQAAKALGLAADDVARVADTIDDDVVLRVAGAQRGGPNRRAIAEFISRIGKDLKAEQPSIDSIAYDERKQEIVVQLTDRSVTADKISARGPVPYRVVYIDQPMQKTAAVGGTAYYLPDGTIYCTAGFIAMDPEGRPGILTAGHCNGSASSYVYKDGTSNYTLTPDTRLYRHDGYADMRFLRLGTTNWLPRFVGNKGEAARALTGRRTLASTTARYTDGASQGTTVCFYGRTTGPSTGQGCGEVMWKQVYFPATGAAWDGQAGSYHVQMTGNFACFGGDSGAPVFAWNTAFGIQNGCSTTSMTVGERTLTYTSTDLAYDKGFSLAY